MRYVLALMLVLSSATGAQQPAPLSVTTADYARAEHLLPANAAPLVLRSGVRPTWLEGDRFWYRVSTENGFSSVLVDAGKAERGPCTLPPCEARGDAASGRQRPNDVVAPDGRRAVFIRDWNLWIRDLSTGDEAALTTDGSRNFGYATDNAGWRRSDRPVVRWSPDSRRLATFQQDERRTGDMYVVQTGSGHPTLRAWKYPFAGDDAVTTIERVVIDIDRHRVVRFDMPADQHRSTGCDDILCDGEWADVQWSGDGSKVVFVSTSRDHRRAVVKVADATTGSVRDLFEESSDTYFESGIDRVNWRYLSKSSEIIWSSERDDWAHLYLYDAGSGRLKRQLVDTPGNVTQILGVDETARTIDFVGVGMEPGRDPYYRHVYRVRIDGGRPTLLTPADADHDVSLAPSGRFFVDTWSTPETPPVSELRDRNGALVLTLERADISRLRAAGWRAPRPIVVKARDDMTDLYGLMYLPSTLDETKKYPIINHVYPGPQRGSVGSRAFWPGRNGRADAQALAELGLIVVEIDGMGTPFRTRRFHEASYGNLGDNTLPDQVTAMRQLAQRYPWIDLARAGIYGHSGGGYAAATAMFRYPELFKVGISESGNHDNRLYEDDWAEKWHGTLTRNRDGTTSYDSQATPSMAARLEGKLLLVHGTTDTNVPPDNTLLVVDALIKANKDFDLLMLPNRGHNFENELYMVRRRWDYFVRYLLGAEPPKEYPLHTPTS
jgi:dipeptidyl aminopeptidase/acylaminoacyl peptidase